MSVVATLLVRVAANLSELDKTFTELERAADRVAKTYNRLGGQLQGIGPKLSTSITLPIVAMGAAAAKSAIDFDTAMRGVQAAVQPTTQEMEQLQAAAIEWGQKTQFSATEAAQALGELGKAGIKSADSIKLLPSVLNLATVGEMDLASAAALTTDTLAQFKLEAKDSERVNDVLAAAAQASTTSVKELGNALVYAGPVAGAFGMSIAETGAALAQFAKLGVKGEMAGTALRNVLAEVKNPAKGMRDVLEELNIKTLANADGTVHLTEVIHKLQTAGASAAQIMQAFGDRAGPAMVAAVGRGAEELRKLTTEMDNSKGAAQRVAETLLSGVGGAIEKMRGAVETAGISLGQLLLPTLTAVADAVGRLAEWVSGTLVPAFKALPQVVQVGIGGFIGLVAAIGPLVYIAGTLASSYGALAGLLSKTSAGARVATTAAEGLTGALQAESISAKLATYWTAAFEAVAAVLASPITWVVVAVGALVLGLRALTGSWEGVLQVLTLGLVDFETLERLWDGLQVAAGHLSDAFVVIQGEIRNAIGVITAEFKPAVEAMQRLVTDVGNAIKQPLVEAMREAGDVSQASAEQGLQKFATALGDLAKIPVHQALIQLRGQLVATQLLFKWVADSTAFWVNVLRTNLLATIKMVEINIVGFWNATKKLADLFGVTLPASLREASSWLKSFGINLDGAAGGFSSWVNKITAGLPTLANLAGAARDAAAGAQGAWTTSREAGEAFATFVPGVTKMSGAMGLAGIQLGTFGVSIRDTITEGRGMVRTLAEVTEATQKHEQMTKEQKAALKKAAEEAKKAAEEFQKLKDKMSGADVIANARELMSVLAALTAQGMKPSAEGAKQLTDAIVDTAAILRGKKQQIAQDMVDVWHSFLPQTTLADDLRDWANVLAKWARSLVPLMRNNLKPMQAALFAAFQIPDPNLGPQVEKFLRGAKMADRIKQWGLELQGQFTDIFGSMFTGQTGFEDGFRSMFSGLQGVASGILRDFGKDFMAEFNDIFEGGDFDWENIFGGEKNKAAGAAAGAAVGLTVGLAFGKSFGKVTGALVGAGSGAAMGAVYGGWVGAGVGAAVGGISGYIAGLTKESAQREALENAKQQLIATFGSMGQLATAAMQTGVDLDDLFKTQSPEHFTRLINRLNTELAKNKTAVENVAKALDQATESGELLSQVDLSRMALNLGKLPTAPGFIQDRGALQGSEEAAFAFIKGQQNAALAGLDAFLTNAQIKTKEGALAISGSLAGIYQTLLEGGASPSQAFAQMEPVIAKLQAQLAKTGKDASAAFAPLGALAAMSAHEIGGPLMDAMAGLSQGLTSTANLGLLNQDTFHGFAQEILAGYKGMEALGQGGEVALAGARDGIQKLWELSTDFGYTLNEDEQAMVDFGLASGTIGDKFRPAADRMANAIEALVDRMEKFLLKFEEIAPASTDASRAIERTLGNMRIPPIDIPFRPRWEEDYPPGAPPRGPAPAGTPSGMVALGRGGIVTRPTVALIGESGPEVVMPLSQADFRGDTDVTVMLDSEVLTRAVLRKQPRVLRAYGAAR